MPPPTPQYKWKIRWLATAEVQRPELVTNRLVFSVPANPQRANLSNFGNFSINSKVHKWMQELPQNTHFLNAPAGNYLRYIARFSVNPKLKQ